MCVRVCVRVCVCASVRASVRAHVHANSFPNDRVDSWHSHMHHVQPTSTTHNTAHTRVSARLCAQCTRLWQVCERDVSGDCGGMCATRSGVHGVGMGWHGEGGWDDMNVCSDV